MKVVNVQAKILAILTSLIVLIFVLIPFHAFLTVWLASIFGHYTLLRLWKEFLLIILFGGLVYLVYTNPKLRWKLISYKLHWLILGYILVQLIWGIVALAIHHVTAKALGYAWIVNLRFLLFFLVVWAVAVHEPSLIKRWPKLLIWPLAIVVVIGFLQYTLLPYDFLKHFGYNAHTIYPYETINHNIHRLRVMSTLRGANPLGAYLSVALTLLLGCWFKHKDRWRGLLLAGGAVVLVLTFSRGAWISLALSAAILAFATIRTKKARQYAVGTMLIGAALVALVTFGLRNNIGFQDALFHTDVNSRVPVSSNEGHVSALKSGTMDMLREPFGRGPGTAGPASVYNNHPARIAENYYVQIGQETGWIGLLLFIGINVVLARALWRRRHQSLALGLFASLIGLIFVNLVSHAWVDDTLAYLWWGLAGIAVATELGSKDEV